MRINQVKTLHIEGWNLNELPPDIGKLGSLETLILNNNILSRLPEEMLNLKDLRVLELSQNKLPIPPEILEKVDEPQKILSYYFSIGTIDLSPGIVTNEARGANIIIGKPLNEIKLLTVGQGSVGKTSLVQQILHGTFDPNQTKTEGISINLWR